MANKVDAKVVLLGKNYSGKTCLFQRYLHGGYDGRRMETIAAAFGAKNEVIDERSLTLGIWDTAGSERYESMSRIYYRGARAAIICYDLTDSSSFDKVKFWVKELQTHEENCKIYLCGTKLDLVMKDQNMRKVDYHFTTDYANEIHAKLFETSSLEGDNICQLFHDIAKTCLEDQPFETYMEAEPLILEAPNKRKKCSCR